MIKESYIGGDYIETTGGSSKTYAGKNIENSSLGNQFIQNGVNSGVTYAVNEPAPNLKHEERKCFCEKEFAKEDIRSFYTSKNCLRLKIVLYHLK